MSVDIDEIGAKFDRVQQGGGHLAELGMFGLCDRDDDAQDITDICTEDGPALLDEVKQLRRELVGKDVGGLRQTINDLRHENEVLRRNIEAAAGGKPKTWEGGAHGTEVG